jgi:hypothetical protein
VRKPSLPFVSGPSPPTKSNSKRAQRDKQAYSYRYCKLKTSKNQTSIPKEQRKESLHERNRSSTQSKFNPLILVNHETVCCRLQIKNMVAISSAELDCFETPAKMALSVARSASPESSGKEIVSCWSMLCFSYCLELHSHTIHTLRAQLTLTYFSNP